MDKKVIAAILALLLGWMGAHKFYMGKYFQAILYILFCWTGIPTIVSFVEGIIYLCESEEKFLSRINNSECL